MSDDTFSTGGRIGPDGMWDLLELEPGEKVIPLHRHRWHTLRSRSWDEPDPQEKRDLQSNRVRDTRVTLVERAICWDCGEVRDYMPAVTGKEEEPYDA